MASKSTTKIDPSRLPAHVAVIMDGNGRWAKKRHLPRIAGHKVGMQSVRAMVRACDEFGVRFLTLYAFSKENWRRPRKEVGFLMKLLEVYLRGEIDELHESNVRITSIGRTGELPLQARRELARAEKRTAANTGLTLALALNYGARQELVDAVGQLVKEARSDKKARVDEGAISRRLYTREMPDPDLIIRTSGEMRLSNFLLWQAAYAEIYVTPTLWPDFRKPHLKKALLDFQKRERRFGGVSERKAP
jgi:undecaprenyl diphosphate synthase